VSSEGKPKTKRAEKSLLGPVSKRRRKWGLPARV